MKTITKTLALFFAAVAFTACTNQSIEPSRPATQIKTDTTHRLGQSPADGDQPTKKILPEKMVPIEGVDQDDTQPAPVAEPTPYPIAVPAHHPVPAVMPVEQISALNN